MRGRVLELGCGYGRALAALVGTAELLVGIDTALGSLALARKGAWRVAATNAGSLGFRAASFDLVACIQNGISVFGVDRRRLVAEAVRVVHPGGTVLLSSYSPAFWPHRLEWFERQSALGLVGPIDFEVTRPGRIVCRDGFVSGTTSADEFASLAASFGRYEITDN
ncbi:MAG: class I SAM-dependent methyltransferase, partial [Thermoanaerobaculia bacterium]|nr:class I SAM-dependent methyltransferase [Thermoanaerobaculia bacterium]